MNSSPETLGNIKNTINLYDRNLSNNIHLCFGDLRDKNFLEGIFNQSKNISGVIHFAGLKSVSESISKSPKLLGLQLNWDNQFIKSNG